MFIVGGLIALLSKKCVGLDIGGSDDPYMRRRYMIPRNRFLNVYCHEVLRDDDDRALHDHPWCNLSILLCGGYREAVFVSRPEHGSPLPDVALIDRHAGQFIFRRAAAAHRLVLYRDRDGNPVPCWSIFITGPTVRSWGFWCPLGRWVHWRSFTAGPRGEVIGRGCGDA